MNSTYFYEYVDLLERVFSFARHNLYSYGMVEKSVSYSSFFQKLEKNRFGYSPIIDDQSLIKEIFGEEKIDLNSVPSYRECAWAAECYLTIQNETGLTFEAIFLVLPIEKMYEYFPLYHEMDFSQIVNDFNERYKKESILSIVINRLDYSIKYISQNIGLSYDSLSSYKQRRRDIKKMSADSACLLASLLRIRIETLIELKVM